MADLTITLNATAGTVSHVQPVSAQTETRFVDWLWYAFPQMDVTDPDNPVPKPRTPANEAAAYRDWARRVVAGAWGEVKRYEQNEAAQAAREAVGDLD